jgi:hypothetical protein
MTLLLLSDGCRIAPHARHLLPKRWTFLERALVVLMGSIRAPTGYAVNESRSTQAHYDAVKDFTPIAMVGGTPNALVVSPSLPVKTLAEFIACATANKGKLSYGSSGAGTLTHLIM